MVAADGLKYVVDRGRLDPPDGLENLHLLWGWAEFGEELDQ